MNTPPSSSPIPLELARLRLRALREGDLDRYQAYRGDPHVSGWQGWRELSRSQAQAFLVEMAAQPFCPPGRWCQIAVAERDGDALLGNIGLLLREEGDGAGAVKIGITLARAAQGRGLATEALQAIADLVFARTSANRLEAVSDTRHVAALRLLERCGFVPVATLPALQDGEPCAVRHFVRHRRRQLPVQLRPARADDAAAVAQVMLDARRQRMPFAPLVHGDDEVRQWVAGELLPAGGVTVAELDGRVVGMLAVRQGLDAGWIEQLYVAPAAAGGGGGAALLKRALTLLKPPVRLYAFQAHLHARGFYERHGFTAIAFGDGSDNEEGLPDILFERRVSA
ncbi:GNAT family N-acetyltransferase [Rubrivivax sp. A210]|uniref:GNAT family N-acetyltransferase n=1 Tax=Rubrivivax sp. A210 TaxID=2772301 RepID=UPI00191915B7|nr:GNAT family N-acetyltransferase [Rubrivivax sp. A210]CAD5373278.1 GNAT family N-acetyltransferase [Rubrivivax sp. A210]